MTPCGYLCGNRIEKVKTSSTSCGPLSTAKATPKMKFTDVLESGRQLRESSVRYGKIEGYRNGANVN